jgi:two-component system chemotaxis response regulator CheB
MKTQRRASHAPRRNFDSAATFRLSLVVASESSMANREILAIGTSAGGVEALQYLASRLPADLPATVLMTIHLSGHLRSFLDDTLTRVGPLPASFAKEGEAAKKRGSISRRPGGLLVDGERLMLGGGRARTMSGRRSTPCCGPSRCAAVIGRSVSC